MNISVFVYYIENISHIIHIDMFFSQILYGINLYFWIKPIFNTTTKETINLGLGAKGSK
jgi:hypothetical protein